MRLSLDQLRPWLVDLLAPERAASEPEASAQNTAETSLTLQARTGSHAPAPGPLDFAALFGNAQPVEMEVGFGKGLFLLTASAARPDVNFLGVEIERKYALYTAGRLAKRDRHNVRVVCGDARTFLPGFIPDASLQAVHVFFPDPWWKKRHRKRRVFTEEFAQQCRRVLRPGGQLHVVSDVQEYFETITQLVAGLPEFAPLPPPEERKPEHDLDYLTNFDRKYRREGRPIHRAQYLRK